MRNLQRFIFGIATGEWVMLAIMTGQPTYYLAAGATAFFAWVWLRDR